MQKHYFVGSGLKLVRAVWIVTAFLFVPLCHAEQVENASANTGGGIAPIDAIFQTGRGNVFTEAGKDHFSSDLAGLPAQPIDQPVVSSIDLLSSANSATEIQTISNPAAAESERVLARGDLVDRQSEPEPLTQNLVRNIAFSLGGVALSASLDRQGDEFAINHGNNTGVKVLTNVGNVLPFVAIGFAGLAALNTTDPRLSRTGFSALQAGGASALSSFALKYAFGRARPEANLGSSAFHEAGISKGDSSFPSIHAATAWGVLTPFAKEYEMPWLYGVAALTNFARVSDRKHWVSDTVAGALIGYWAGDLAWQRNKPKPETSTQIYVGDRSIRFVWPF